MRSARGVRLRWIDLVRPAETYGCGEAPRLETAFDTAQWLMKTSFARHIECPLRMCNRNWTDGDRVPHLSEKFEKELRSIFRGLLLARPAPKTEVGRWMADEQIAIDAVRSVPVPRFVKSDDEEIRGSLGDVLNTKKGALTAYSWNPIHPWAREITEVRLLILPDGFAYDVTYRIPDDGSSWSRRFDAPGESIRAFVRRWPFMKILSAPPDPDMLDNYVPWMNSDRMDPGYVASRWRNYGESGPQWVGFDTTGKTPRIGCMHCDSWVDWPMPQPFPRTAARIARFDLDHRHCQPRSTT